MFASWKFLAALCLAIGALCCVEASRAVAAEPDRSIEDRIQAVERGLLPSVRIKDRTQAATIADRMQHFHVPGVSVAVINGYRLEWARGYGVADAKQQTPVTDHTLFQAASISKPVSALGALKLVDQGKLTLDRNINDVLKSWKLPENELTRQHTVSLRCLLSHTAGTTVHGFPGYLVDTELPTLQQILDGAAPANTGEVRVDKLPGEGFRYSGGGTTIVQQLIEDASGLAFAEFLQAEVLSPVGMTDSTFEQPLPAARHAQAASGHRADGRVVEGLWHVYPERAAAGLWTTSSDLAKYAIAIQLAHRGEAHPVLSHETVEQMLTPQNGGPVGLGPFISSGDGWPRFRHGGSNDGFRCQLIADLERGQGAVVMTNSDRGDAVAFEILNAIADVYDWPGYLPPERAVAMVDDSVLARYAGSYAVPKVGAITIKVRDGVLHARPLFAPEFAIFLESETEFFTDQPNLRGKFVVGEDGSIEIVLTGGGDELRGKKQ